MWFTCLCPYCGATLRLLRKLLDHKVMCPDCRKPFLAEDADTHGGNGGDAWSAAGWFVVCPSCGHTEWVADALDRQTHCPRCDAALPRPTVGSRRPGRRRRHEGGLKG